MLWLHDLPNDPENAHLRDAASRARFAKFIFVSEWQRSAYAQYFGDVFGDKATVLRNAVEPFPRQRREPPRDGVMRLIYHTTPHRGLDVLMRAFAKVYERYEGKVHLDVYSSFTVYGWTQRDAPFEHLFETCRRHAGCTYHGAVSNEEVREALTRAHVFAYPSTWMETSCIAAIEALSAGVHVVSSNLGALPETLRGFGTTYPYDHDKGMHADTFERALVGAIDSYWQPEKIRLRRYSTSVCISNFRLGESRANGTGGRVGPDSRFHARRFQWRAHDQTRCVRVGCRLFERVVCRESSTRARRQKASVRTVRKPSR